MSSWEWDVDMAEDDKPTNVRAFIHHLLLADTTVAAMAEAIGLSPATTARIGYTLGQRKLIQPVTYTKDAIVKLPAFFRAIHQPNYGHVSVTLNLRSMIYRRDGRTCVYCGVETTSEPRGAGRTLDHIIPKSRGGWCTPENLAVACRSCNCRKTVEVRQGWHVI